MTKICYARPRIEPKKEVYTGGSFPERYERVKWVNIVQQFEEEKNKLFKENSDMEVNIMMYRAMRCIPYAVYLRNKYPAFCRCYMGVIFRSALKESDKIEYKKDKFCSIYSPEFDGQVKEREFADYFIAKQNPKYGYDYWDLRHRDTGNRPWGCVDLFNINSKEPYEGFMYYVQACVEILNNGTFRPSGFDTALSKLTPKATSWPKLKENQDELFRLLNMHMLWHPNNSDILVWCKWVGDNPDYLNNGFREGMKNILQACDPEASSSILDRLKQANPWNIPGKDGYEWPEKWQEVWSMGRSINCLTNDMSDWRPNLWILFELGDPEKLRYNLLKNPIGSAQDALLKRCNDVVFAIENAAATHGSSIWKFVSNWIGYLDFARLAVGIVKPKGPLTAEKLASDMQPYIDYFDHDSGWSARSMSGATQKYQWTKLPKERVEALLKLKAKDKEGYSPPWQYFDNKNLGQVVEDKTCKAHAELEFMRHCVAGCDGLPPMLNNRGLWEPRSARMCKSVEAAHTTIPLKAVILQACNIYYTYFLTRLKQKLEESKGKKKQGLNAFFDIAKKQSLYHKNHFELLMINDLIQVWNKSPYMFLPLGNGHWFVDAFDQVVEAFKVQGWTQWIAKNGIPFMYKGASLPPPPQPTMRQLEIFWAELVGYAIYGGQNSIRAYWMPTPSNRTTYLYPLTDPVKRRALKKAPNDVKKRIIQILMNPYYAGEVGNTLKMEDIYTDTGGFKQFPTGIENKEINWNIDAIVEDVVDIKDNGQPEVDMKQFKDLWPKLDKVLEMYLYLDVIWQQDEWWDASTGMTQFSSRRASSVDEQFCQWGKIDFEENYMKTYWIQQGFDLKYKKSKLKCVWMKPHQLRTSSQDKGIMKNNICMTSPKNIKHDSDGMTCPEKYFLPFYSYSGRKEHEMDGIYMNKLSIFNILTKYEWPLNKNKAELTKQLSKYTRNSRSGTIHNKKDFGIPNLVEVLTAYDCWAVQHFMFMEIAVRGTEETLGLNAADPYRGLDRYRKYNWNKRPGKLKFNIFTTDFLRIMSILPGRTEKRILDKQERKALWNKYHENIQPLGPFFTENNPARGAENMMLPIIGIPASYYNFEPRRLAIGFFEAIQEVASKRNYKLDMTGHIGETYVTKKRETRAAGTRATYIVKPVRTFVGDRAHEIPWKRGIWTATNLKGNTKVNCQPTNICYYIGEAERTLDFFDFRDIDAEKIPEESLITGFTLDNKDMTDKDAEAIDFMENWLNNTMDVPREKMNDAVWYYPDIQAQELSKNEGKLVEPHPLSKIAFYYLKASNEQKEKEKEQEQGSSSTTTVQQAEVLMPLLKNLKLKF